MASLSRQHKFLEVGVLEMRLSPLPWLTVSWNHGWVESVMEEQNQIWESKII